MTTDVIDVTLNGSSFPATYVGDGTLIGNPYYTPDADLLTLNWTGDGNAVSIPLGFTAQNVKVIDETGVIIWEWSRGLAATHTLKTVTAGTLTVDTTSAIGVTTADGRSTVLLSAALNVSGHNLLAQING